MLCAYPTAKYVEIHDTRLVILRYILLLAICIYVGFFEMFAMGGWLDPSPVVGVVRFSLQQPTVNNCDPTLDNCRNAFAPLNTLPYCQQYYNNSNISSSFNNRTTVNYPGKIFPCEIYEAVNAQLMQEKSLTIITRASTTEQELACPSNNSSAMTCPKTYNNLSPEYKFYTAQSESFTVLMDHAVTASKICNRNHDIHTQSQKHSYACSAEASAYPGRLYSQNDDLCRQEHLLHHNAFVHYRGSTETDTAPCYINPNRTNAPSNQDFFSLDVLLQAAGVHLDDCNELADMVAENNDDNYDNINTKTTSCQTYRDSGATLLLNIYWNDFVPYQGLVEPHYYYQPQLVARSSYKQYVPFYDNHYRQHRTLLNAHGIRIAVLLGGEFNQFNVVTFLVTLTTALGLLAVATTIVDSLMLYVLPEKDRYQQVKYEQTHEVFEANDVVTSTVVRAGMGLGQLLVVHNSNNDNNDNNDNNNNATNNDSHTANNHPRNSTPEDGYPSSEAARGSDLGCDDIGDVDLAEPLLLSS